MIIKEILIEKYNNFINFLKSKFPEQHKEISTYENIRPELIIEYIKIKIMPMSNDLELLMMSICNENNFDFSKINQEDKNKIKRYCQFFIEIYQKINE